jgi:hypothetical protein
MHHLELAVPGGCRRIRWRDFQQILVLLQPYDPKDAVRLMAEIVAFITGGMCREAPATIGSNKRKK